MEKQKSINTPLYYGMAHKLLMWDENPSDEPLNPEITAYTYDMSEHSYGVENTVLPLSLMHLHKGTQIHNGISDDDTKVIAKNRLKKKIDALTFNLLLNYCPPENIIKSKYLGLDDISFAMCKIETHNCIAAKIMLHPEVYALIRIWNIACFEQATFRDMLMAGLYAHLYSADIHVSNEMPKNKILITGTAFHLGILQQKSKLVHEEPEPKIFDHYQQIYNEQPQRNFELIKSENQWTAKTDLNIIVRNPNIVAVIEI